jgi:2-oxoisovalerate dehydrogenase E1 component
MAKKVGTTQGKVLASTEPNSHKNGKMQPKPFPLTTEEILQDYRIACISREASLLGRKEVLSGKAKFGIFGDGKEVAQLAMARAFQKGDIRSGYYRDQTFMFALGISTVQQFFAQLYAHTDVEAEPSSAGRSMNGHFGTRTLNADGTWKNLTDDFHSSSDVSPTGSQMPRLVGLAYASRLYRELPELQQFTQFSQNGNEIAFGTIGNASSAEGMFWEAVNAIGVLKAPALISLWDDGYGISVPNEFQVTKGNLSELLSGFAKNNTHHQGFSLYTVPGWNYEELVKTYSIAAEKVRKEHIPAIIHVPELTQPQGHSTSGTHTRYKSAERLQFEVDFDCIPRMRQWILDSNYATTAQLDSIEKDAVDYVKTARQNAWDAYMAPIKNEITEITTIIRALASEFPQLEQQLQQQATALDSIKEPFRRDSMGTIFTVLLLLKDQNSANKQSLIAIRDRINSEQTERYSSHLHSQSAENARRINEVLPVYSESSKKVNGSEVLNAFFDVALQRDPRIIAFGEDVGQLGDVNQAFINMQSKYGALRVSDTGIREVTILGQAIGMAMRGLRPIAEIQYLDYILYALQLLSDDLATVQWRTKGGQKAPVIIRTRGHRLEGIWHAGSPMAGIINLVRGIHVCVPRNMTQAAGFYNTLLQSDEPAIVVEVLNGYRLKELVPENIETMTVPLGVPEVIREGTDITIVTYGACCRVAEQASELLASVGISVEIIDVRTLLPFDVHSLIVESLKKTNRILFLDEDVPGGTTSFMMQHVLERDNGYKYLDSKPVTLTAKDHRTAYGTDGAFWTKPDVEHIFETVYEIMNEADPKRFPIFYS